MGAIVAFLRKPAVLRVARIALGLVFVVAGLAKIVNLGAFADQVHNFRILPVALENLAAMTLPWIEVVAGLALLLGLRARSGAVLAAVLMAVFTVAVAQAMARGLDFECGCFGTADSTRVGLEKLLQNLGLTALALVASLRVSPDR